MNPRTLTFMTLFLVAGAGLPACDKGGHDAQTGHAEGDSKELFGEMTVDQLDAMIAQAKAGTAKLAIYDNNQHDRYVQSRITTAKWVDFKNVQASDLPADKDTTLVFYCANEH